MRQQGRGIWGSLPHPTFLVFVVALLNRLAQVAAECGKGRFGGDRLRTRAQRISVPERDGVPLEREEATELGRNGVNRRLVLAALEVLEPVDGSGRPALGEAR